MFFKGWNRPGGTPSAWRCWPWPRGWVWRRARRRTPATAFDREWLAFRDRFGLVWGLPARDQFNRAAANAGWGVVLDWRGLRTTAGAPAAPHAEALAGLRGVLKRFGPEGSPS